MGNEVVPAQPATSTPPLLDPAQLAQLAKWGINTASQLDALVGLVSHQVRDPYAPPPIPESKLRQGLKEYHGPLTEWDTDVEDKRTAYRDPKARGREQAWRPPEHSGLWTQEESPTVNDALRTLKRRYSTDLPYDQENDFIEWANSQKKLVNGKFEYPVDKFNKSKYDWRGYFQEATHSNPGQPIDISNPPTKYQTPYWGPTISPDSIYLNDAAQTAASRLLKDEPPTK